MRQLARAGFFLQDELRLGEAFIVTLGARYDRYETFGGTLNPRAALVWTPRDATAVKLLYGTAFRAPNVYELYYAAGEQYVQNPELDPERIATYELVLEQKLGSVWQFTAGGFHYRIEDVISLVEDPADGLFVYENTGELKATGVELEAAGRWPGGFQAVASWSWQEVRSDIDGEEDMIPKHSRAPGQGAGARTDLREEAAARRGGAVRRLARDRAGLNR